MTLEESKVDYLWKWQQRLKLRDWTINFKEIEKFDEDNGPGQTGESHLRHHMLEADIIIRSGMVPQEWKRTIVHELLHVRFPTMSLGFEYPHTIETESEIGIEVLARYLADNCE